METLYKRNKNGKIQQWNIEAYGDQIIITQGQVDGKLQEYKRTSTPKNVGKSNETTSVQQAFSEATSEWKGKHDEGYKTVGDIGTWNDGEYNSLLDFLDTNLPTFNTDASDSVKPMLAPSKVADLNKLEYPLDVQPKYDGARTLATADGLTSRSGKPYTTAPHIIKVLKDAGFEGILDGELYIPGASFQTTIRAIKKTSPDSARLVLRVYDIVNDKEWKKRYSEIVSLVYILDSPSIILTPTYTVTTPDEVMQLHNQFVEAGEEGAMVRIHNGIYQPGFRSKYLQKVKMFDDAEFKFMSFVLGERQEDLIAVCITDKSQSFKASMVGDRDHKTKLWEDWNKGNIVAGDLLTIKYQGLTDDGIPRFPKGKAFRDYE